MDKHTIFYDAECPICIREIALILEDNRAEYFKAVAIQGNEEILKQYGITAEDALTYLHILRNDGVMLGKMPAVRLMYRGFKGFALVKLANLPLLDRLADLIYPWFARNRYRFPARRRWPCAAFAADDGGLSQCPRVFRDNMEIAVFTMPCPPDSQDAALPPEKMTAHLRRVQECETRMAGGDAAQAARIEKELLEFVGSRAKTVRALEGKPQEMAVYCRKQNETAHRLLLTY
jgi:hypothetical protein